MTKSQKIVTWIAVAVVGIAGLGVAHDYPDDVGFYGLMGVVALLMWGGTMLALRKVR